MLGAKSIPMILAPRLAAVARKLRSKSRPSTGLVLTDTPRSRSRKSQLSCSDGMAPDRGCPAESATETVTLPRQHMVRFGFQRALVPDLLELVVAEFAIGRADRVGNIRMVVVVKRRQLLDSRGALRSSIPA